ncbi:MAG: hypothetical protein E7504_04875, partial [Ruminococcus sp.]|nr:hypothetical protein [Ruminococcus sp.]
GEKGDDGYTPIRGVDYWTEADVEAINTATEAFVVSELADRAQLEPLFAESVEWLNETGDTTKLYVLPDGYIYAYMTSEVLVPAPNEFDVDAAKLNTRLSSSGSESTGNGIVATDYISVSLTSPYYVTFSGIDSIFKHGTYAYAIHLTYFDSGKNRIGAKVLQADTINLPHTFNIFDSSYSNAAFVRFAICINSSSAITKTDCEGLSVVCESKSETITTTGWFSTKHAFVPADYEDRIIDLENDVNNLKIGFDNEISVPDFWENAVEDCISKIKSLQNGRNTVTFAFFSDNHQNTRYLGSLIGKVMQDCYTPYCFFGGDAIDSGTLANESDMIANDKAFDEALSIIPVERMCRAVGNHDGYWVDNNGTKHWYTRPQIYDLFLRQESVAQNKHYGGDGTYYYVEDLASETIFVVCNTNYNVNTATETLDNEQINWLSDVVFKEFNKSKTLVFISHQPITNNYHSNIYADTAHAIQNLLTDKINDGWNVVGWFSGHIHADRIYQVDHTTNPEANDQITVSLPWKTVTIRADHTGLCRDEDLIHAIGNDDQSHAIDFVTINKDTRTVNITRLGIGEDRSFTY